MKYDKEYFQKENKLKRLLDEMGITYIEEGMRSVKNN